MQYDDLILVEYRVLLQLTRTPRIIRLAGLTSDASLQKATEIPRRKVLTM